MTLPNRFCSREHDEYLAAVTVHLLRDREAKYPTAIDKGLLTQADAARKLELMRCIVAQWRWIADPARPLCPAEDADGRLFGAYNFELVDELDAIVVGQRQRAAKSGGDEWHATFLLLVEALAWWQRDRDGRPTSSLIVHFVRYGREDWHRRRMERKAA